MINLNDTIAAIATPAGTGGIGIVKISGPDAFVIADRVMRLHNPQPLTALKGFTAKLAKAYDRDGTLIDETVVLVYRGPKSYTGEDTVEIMCHGGELVCDRVLRAVLASGATMAGRGEFTRRAFVSGRISLTEAEAVCDLINAASKQGVAAAAALSDGALARKIESLKARILDLQAHIAAWIDFPEEDVDDVDDVLLLRELMEILNALTRLCDSFELGADLIRGVPTVIVGSPNVGKSTLLNLLAGAPKALVTPIAGTTRDVVEQKVRLGGTALLLADTAGIRESDDPIEQLGVALARQKLETAGLVLAVFDSSRLLDKNDLDLIAHLQTHRVVAVINKTDLESKLNPAPIEQAFGNLVYISANDPAALDALDAAVAAALSTTQLDPDEPVLANERQRLCADRARDAVAEAHAAALNSLTPDIVFALLSDALNALADLSGENVTESVLDAVFSKFCVGK